MFFPPSTTAAPSILTQLTNNTLGGLQYLGETLDKPGRAVRGSISALAGGPAGGGLLNLIPFSDTMGITDPQQAVAGRDLLDMAGITPKNELGFHPIDNPTDALGDVAGFGTELLLDPLSWLTFGSSALTQGGKEAAKAGTLAKTASGRIAAGQGGLVGLGLPFQQPSIILGKGATAGKVAEKMIDPAMEAIKYGKYSPIPRARSLFDSTVKGIPHRAAQRVYDAAAGQDDALEAAARAGGLTARETAAQLGMDDRLVGHAIDVLEGADPARLGLTPDELARVNQFNETFTQVKDAPYLERGKLGKRINPRAGHAPRYATKIEDKALNKATGRRAMSGWSSSDVARDEALALLRRSQINQLTTDPQFAGFGRSLNDLQAAHLIRRDMLGVSPTMISDVMKQIADHNLLRETMDPAAWTQESSRLLAQRDELVSKWKAGQSLANWAKEVPHANLPQPAPIFGNSPLDDLQQYLGEQYRAIGSHRNALDLVANNAILGPRAANNRGAMEALIANGLDDTANLLDPLAERLSASAGIPIEEAKAAIAKGQVQLPREIYDLLAVPQAPWQVPNALAPAVDAYDKLMSVTKGGLTSMLPMGIPFSARNRTGGMAKSFVERSLGGRGTLDAGAVAAGKGVSNPEAYAHLIGSGLSPEDATRELAKLAYIHAGIGDVPRGQLAGQLQGDVAGQVSRMPLPGEPGWVGNGWTGLKDWATQGWSGNWIPGNGVGVRGGFGGIPVDQPSTWTPAMKGEQLATGTESINRLETFLNKALQGYSPAEAGKTVRDAHFDYSALAPFEREVMKRIFPFYTFARKNLEHEARVLATDPARPAAMVRAVTDPRSDEYMPAHIRERASMASPTASGAMRYVTGFGLPIEQAAQQFVVGPGGLGRTIDQALAQVNPYPRLLLEELAGRQFFSGRPLGDLDPLLGRLASNVNELAGGQPYTREQLHQFPDLLEQAVSSSPLSRLLSMARTATDPRKRQTPSDLAALALALGTGLKIQDVSPEEMQRSQQREARQMAELMLEQDPSFSKFSRYYMRPEARRNMTPEQAQLMQAYNILNRR